MSSPDITFTTIPSSIRKPGVYTEENTSNALQGLSPLSNTVCLIAQATASGAQPANTPVKVFSESDLILYCGAGSIAHLAGLAALSANPNVALTVLPLADVGGSAAAVGSFGITGIAGNAGNVNFWVGDENINVAVNTGDTAVTIANNAKLALSQVSIETPVTVGVTGTNHIEFTAKNKGTLGNQIALSVKASAGLTGVVFGVTGMNAGSVDPTLGNYLTPGTPMAAVVNGGYNVFISTLNDAINLTSLENMINFASSSTEQRRAVGIFGLTDLTASYSAIETLCGTTLNNGRFSGAYLSYASDNLAKTTSFEIAGAYGSVIASNDDPAVPYDGLILDPVAPPAVIDRFSRTTQEDLLHNGVTPLEVVPGEQVAIVRAISTYTQNSLGVPDMTLLDLTTIQTLDYVAAQVRQRLTLRFPRSKLSSRTASQVRAEVLDVLFQLQSLQIVQNVQQYASGVLVETDTQDPTRLDVKIPTAIVLGLHVTAALLELIL
jgi:phage tail sheath gpL-like